MELKCILLFSCALVLIGSVNAARRVDASARAVDTMRRRRENALMKREEPGELDTRELFQLTAGESMKEVRKETDAHGTIVERLQEEYHGIPVFDSSVTVRKDDHGHLTGDAAGVLIQNIAEDLLDTDAKLTDEDTLEIVIQAEGDEKNRYLISDVKYSRFIFMDANDQARLVNQVSYLIDGVKSPTYITDLKSGEILQHWNSLMTVACCKKLPQMARLFGGNEKMGWVEYGNQPYCLDFTVDDCNNCYLENKYVRVVDMNQTSDKSLNETASFPCDEDYGDAVNGAYSPAIDAFFHGTMVGKMFEEWYGTTVLKEKMVIRVHYSNNIFPMYAFWNGKYATFEDGDDKMYPFTTIDVVAHEFGHGVVQQGSGLLYFDEMGGLNEAFADIMGETTEEFLLKSDFFTGKNIMKNRKYLREFENPANDNVSIGHVDEMTQTLNVHRSSGVYRRIWYVLIKEQEMEIRTAFNVFRYANKMYWHYMSSFFDGSCGLLRAAMDLGVSTKPFLLAFEDVGLPRCNVSSHIFSLKMNKTQRGVKVDSNTEPVFAFKVPAWGQSLSVEAITPSGGPGSIEIELYKGSWDDEEFDNAELVLSGTDKLTYVVKGNDSDSDDLRFEERSVRSTTIRDRVLKHQTSGPSNSRLNDSHGTKNTGFDVITDVIQSETDVKRINTPPEPTLRMDYNFFIKLSSPRYNNDVEITAGYACRDSFKSSDTKLFFLYLRYCKIED